MRRVGPVLTLPVALLALLVPPAAADPGDFPGLLSGTHVRDGSGRSLSERQVDVLQRRLEDLQDRTGADVVVVVRDEDAGQDRTSVQVEDLRTSWASVDGVDEDDVVALLVNRRPGTDDRARVGLDVGSAYDGADDVPLRERQRIITGDLLPALREGDVAAAVDAATARLDRDISDGPPAAGGLRGAVDRYPALPWSYAALVLAGWVALLVVWLRRPRPTAPAMTPSPLRPDRTTPAWMAATLARNRLSVDVLPVALLSLATRGALVLEAQRTGPRRRRSSLGLRLLDGAVERDPVEDVVWDRLVERARGEGVAAHSLRSLATERTLGREELQDALRRRGWLEEHRPRAVRRMTAIAVGAGVLVALRFAASDENTVVGASALAAAVLLLASLGLSSVYPVLSPAGLDVRRAWKAYEKGLVAAVRGDEDLRSADLDVVVADLVALGRQGSVREHLAPAVASGELAALRALAADSTIVAPDSAWSVFSATFARDGGSDTSGGSDSGGGGDSGST